MATIRFAALAKRDGAGHWTEGIVLVGPLADAAGIIDSPIAVVAGEFRQFGLLDAVRVGGLPALLVSDSEAVRAGRLFASPMLAATRGVTAASVGKSAPLDLPTDRVTFDQLGIPAAEVEVFGRANLSAVIDTRRLPAGTRPARLLLDVMVAPNGDNEKAVVSAFLNERMLGSTVAATGEATHLDLALPDGLMGTVGDLRVVVERDSAQGNCRFEPQGYPAQILGSSAVILEKADTAAHDFSDLTPRFAHGFEILLPARAADQPTQMLGLVSQVANQLSPDTAPFEVSFIPSESAPVPKHSVHRGQRHGARKHLPACPLRSRPRGGDRPLRPHAARFGRLRRRRGGASRFRRRYAGPLDSSDGDRRRPAGAAATSP